jgi:hypothetical protein
VVETQNCKKAEIKVWCVKTIGTVCRQVIRRRGLDLERKSETRGYFIALNC